jgi:hypothetical protein
MEIEDKDMKEEKSIGVIKLNDILSMDSFGGKHRLSTSHKTSEKKRKKKKNKFSNLIALSQLSLSKSSQSCRKCRRLKKQLEKAEQRIAELTIENNRLRNDTNTASSIQFNKSKSKSDQHSSIQLHEHNHFEQSTQRRNFEQYLKKCRRDSKFPT